MVCCTLLFTQAPVGGFNVVSLWCCIFKFDHTWNRRSIRIPSKYTRCRPCRYVVPTTPCWKKGILTLASPRPIQSAPFPNQKYLRENRLVISCFSHAGHHVECGVHPHSIKNTRTMLSTYEVIRHF